MDIPSLFTRREPVFSFEFFLPKAPEDLDKFIAAVRRGRERLQGRGADDLQS